MHIELSETNKHKLLAASGQMKRSVVEIVNLILDASEIVQVIQIVEVRLKAGVKVPDEKGRMVAFFKKSSNWKVNL
jgi:hypothetical protein